MLSYIGTDRPRSGRQRPGAGVLRNIRAQGCCDGRDHPVLREDVAGDRGRLEAEYGNRDALPDPAEGLIWGVNHCGDVYAT